MQQRVLAWLFRRYNPRSAAERLDDAHGLDGAAPVLLRGFVGAKKVRGVTREAKLAIGDVGQGDLEPSTVE